MRTKREPLSVAEIPTDLTDKMLRLPSKKGGGYPATLMQDYYISPT